MQTLMRAKKKNGLSNPVKLCLFGQGFVSSGADQTPLTWEGDMFSHDNFGRYDYTAPLVRFSYLRSFFGLFSPLSLVMF